MKRNREAKARIRMYAFLELNKYEQEVRDFMICEIFRCSYARVWNIIRRNNKKDKILLARIEENGFSMEIISKEKYGTYHVKNDDYPKRMVFTREAMPLTSQNTDFFCKGFAY